MKWNGDKLSKEIKTIDGYILKVAYVDHLKYWWCVFKENELLFMSKNENDYRKNLSAAQKAAQQVMIRHIKKND